ncbi:aldo/keto reductase [Hirschia baltica]|uniref:Aldo/keto reductase n=1 Tax=Hirschia baltica (strain ATCC 49814 / DSM 5838 / IFAM 1418) TaxID=582402 RepID=C6XI34_HIRBI|nr:aldo/keto reductase [Hirschia baltica]ACT58860.1 aldo/keto reductase [Hirschia baltica ATCC 49814]
MQMRKLGRTDIDVSACCLGTMTYGQQNTEAEGHQQMDYALDRGVNFFDTAELYSIPPKEETYGSTEKVIGSWFKQTGKRDKVILATKIAGRSTMTWMRGEKKYDLLRVTKEQIDIAVEQSLSRLQTDYIDLYQIHWPDRKAEIFGSKLSEADWDSEYETFEAQLEALNTHVEKGNIRHIGLSNERSWGVMRFIQEAEKRGLPRVASIQNAFSLLNRSFEGDLEEVCRHENVSLLAYSPLAQGILSGKYRDGALPEGSRKQLFDRLQRYEGPIAEKATNAYLDLAQELDVDPTQLAIRFCDTRPYMGSTIIGSTTMDQLKTCIDAFDLEWTSVMEDCVNAIHQVQPNPCP